MFTIDQFTFDRAHSVLVAEASTLGLRAGMTPASVIEIRNPQTNRVESFTRTFDERDIDGDLVAWEYRPFLNVACRVRIYND
jgi:hypothetical protein